MGLSRLWLQVQKLLNSVPSTTATCFFCTTIGGVRTEETSEIYDIGGDGYWREGPDIIMGTANGASVQFQDTFLLVGGQDYTKEPIASVIQFKAEPEESWVFLDNYLTTFRMGAAAVLLHEDSVNC